MLYKGLTFYSTHVFLKELDTECKKINIIQNIYFNWIALNI
jgi:hypothetical protein